MAEPGLGTGVALGSSAWITHWWQVYHIQYFSLKNSSACGLSALAACPVFATILWDGCSDHRPHHTGGETEARRRERTCPAQSQGPGQDSSSDFCFGRGVSVGNSARVGRGVTTGGGGQHACLCFGLPWVCCLSAWLPEGTPNPALPQLGLTTRVPQPSTLSSSGLHWGLVPHPIRWAKARLGLY